MHGVAAWYVPKGAEFDRDIDNSLNAQRRVLLSRHVYGQNPWYLSWSEQTRLEDFGIFEHESNVHWDEVEDWDDRIPLREALRPVSHVFEDYADLIGVDYEPTKQTLRVFETELLQEKLEARAEAFRQKQLRERERKEKAKIKRENKRRVEAREKEIRRQRREAQALTVTRTPLLRDLFG